MDPPELICRETGVVRPRPVRPVPKDSCRLPVFSSVSGWRTRPVRGCTASRPACRGCLRFGPARFDAMCLRMRSAQSGPALRAARRFCRRAHGLCAPYVHLRPRRSLPRPALASFAPCASVTAPSAPGPRTLVPPPASSLVPHRFTAARPVCYCGLRPRPAPACRARPARYGGLRLCCARLAAVRPSRPSRPARLWLYRLRPARALLWPPSVLRPACRRPALASFAPCASVTVLSAPGPRTLVPPPAPALVPHRLAAALPARYGGLRLCCAQLAAVRPSRPLRPARL